MRSCDRCGYKMPSDTPRHRVAGLFVCHACASNSEMWADGGREGFKRPAGVRSAMKVEAHDMSQDPLVIRHCPFCFAGDTSYMTPDGPKTFVETVGTTQMVLSAPENDRAGGRWVPAHIHSFGVQKLLRVDLNRNGHRKSVYATPEHRWFVAWGAENREVLTRDLGRDDHLSCLVESDGAFSEDEIDWVVQGVYETDREEEVYCAVVPEYASFALEGNIWVGNCGSGQVVARNDGSVECGFCDSVFTVRAEPFYPSWPQTVNGVPQEVPLYPNTEYDPQNAVQANPEATADPSQGDGLVDPESLPEDDSEDPDDDRPSFTRESLRTHVGDELPEDVYIKHLAIKFATDDAELDRILK